MVGTRVYGAHRQRLEDLDVFRGDIMSIWNEQDFERVHVFHAHPQEARRDQDGAVMMHFIVAFEPSLNPIILLQRARGVFDRDFVVIDPPSSASIALLGSMSPWNLRFLHGYWGQRLLQPLEPLQLADGMHIRLEGDEIPETGGTGTSGFSMLQVSTSRWHAKDKLHGRTIGHNSFRQLRPPGNGHRQVTFSTMYFLVDDQNESYGLADENPFIQDMADSMKQDIEDQDYNPLLADFRRSICFWNPTMHQDRPLHDSWNEFRAMSFYNSFAADFCASTDPLQAPVDLESEAAKIETNTQTTGFGGPCTQICLNKLIPEKLEHRLLPLKVKPTPDFLCCPWELSRREHKCRVELPTSLDLHPATADWLSHQPVEPQQDASGVLVVYTDGSYFEVKDVAAWAIAVCWAPSLDSPPQDMQLIDWYASKVITEEAQNEFVGAEWADATHAEASALIWASLFAIAHHAYQDVILCYDCYGVGMAGAGHFNYTHKYPTVQKLRQLQQAVESKWGISHVHARHVKGHAKDPINELVTQEQAHSWLVEKCPSFDASSLIRDSTTLGSLWLDFSIGPEDPQWPERDEKEKDIS